MYQSGTMSRSAGIRETISVITTLHIKKNRTEKIISRISSLFLKVYIKGISNASQLNTTILQYYNKNTLLTAIYLQLQPEAKYYTCLDTPTVVDGDLDVKRNYSVTFCIKSNVLVIF